MAALSTWLPCSTLPSAIRIRCEYQTQQPGSLCRARNKISEARLCNLAHAVQNKRLEHSVPAHRCCRECAICLSSQHSRWERHHECAQNRQTKEAGKLALWQP